MPLFAWVHCLSSSCLQLQLEGTERPAKAPENAANMTGVALGLGCSALSASPRCQQYQQPPAAAAQRWPGLSGPPRPVPAFGTGTLQLAARRPVLRRPPPPDAADSLGTTGEGSGRTGSGGSGGSSSTESGGLALLLRSAYDWLCSIKPPKTLWRTVAALVLGGEALVRILQGEAGEGGVAALEPRCQHPGCVRQLLST